MANNNFEIRESTDFVTALQLQPNLLKWKFISYVFEKEDVDRIKDMNCQTLILSKASYLNELGNQGVREEILLALVALKGVQKLFIEEKNVPNSLPHLLDLHRFVYRNSVSKLLKIVSLKITGRFNPLLARGLKHASNIKDLRMNLVGTEDGKYMYRYFMCINLEEMLLNRIPPKDCFALLKGETEKLKEFYVSDGSVATNELLSKYSTGVLLKKPYVKVVSSTFPDYPETDYSLFLERLFKQNKIRYDAAYML